MNFFKRRFAFISTILASTMALALFVVPVYAHVSWCSSDPVVRLADGSVLNVVIQAPTEYAGSQVGVHIVTQEGAQLVDVPESDLNLDVDFAVAGQGSRFGVSANPSGNFPLRMTVLRDGVPVAEVEGMPGATVHLQLPTL